MLTPYGSCRRRRLKNLTCDLRFLKSLVLQGQVFGYDEHQKLLYLWIKEPFWSARKKYGWSGRSPAIGVNKEILNFAWVHGAKIRVFVQHHNDRCYETDPETWLSFAERHNAYHQRNSVQICLLQWSEPHFKTVILPCDLSKSLRSKVHN